MLWPMTLHCSVFIPPELNQRIPDLNQKKNPFYLLFFRIEMINSICRFAIVMETMNIDKYVYRNRFDRFE